MAGTRSLTVELSWRAGMFPASKFQDQTSSARDEEKVLHREVELTRK